MKHLLLLSAAVLAFDVANAQTGFTENLGQFKNQEGKPADNVLFKASGTGPGIFITTNGLTYLFEQKRDELVVDRDEVTTSTIDWSAIHMNLIGADIRKENVVMEDELMGVKNYYYAHCPNGILGVKSYHKITIKEIYPGIDWIIMADDVNGVAHDFLVHPNGNHQMIRMNYTGLTAPISMNEENELTLVSKYGTMYEGGLKVFMDHSETPIPAYFNIKGTEVNYFIARRGSGKMLIDPPLQWDTTMASSGMDYGSGVAACRDQSYDVLGCGYTDGSDFPIMNATQGTLSGQEDAVVYRLDASGNRLWSTYFGGTDIDNAKGIATDVNGNAYVVGHTNSQDLPVLLSSQPNYGGGNYDAFVAKFNSSGIKVWASWRGGTGADFATAIDCDNSGTCYVVGYTNTTVNFPLLNPIQATKSGAAGIYDGFIMSFSSAQTMFWSTYYGGTDEDKFRAVDVEPGGGAIAIAGNTMSGNFPTAGNPFQLLNAQAWFTSDAVIIQMTASQVVNFAGYCGGYEDDVAYGVTFGENGNIYATGSTISLDFPKVVLAGAYNDTSQNAIGVSDAFVIKCNGYGTTLFWSSYFGGTGTDYGYGIGYDQFVGVYVCGNTASTDFPLQIPLDNNYYQPVHGDGGNYNDCWMAWFDVNQNLAWSTYYGFANSEEAYDLDISLVGDIYVTGVNFNDIFMAKFNSALPTAIPCCDNGPWTTTLWPVPSTEVLNLIFRCETDQLAIIEIWDVQGRTVFSEMFNASADRNDMQIDISQFNRGLYFMKLHKDGEQEVMRFVKN